MSRSIVLLIDGDSDSIEIYSMILDFHGYEVVPARDGNTGWQLALDLTPDLVISELFLPGLDGQTLLTQLRDDSRTARIPVIVLDSIPGVSDDQLDHSFFKLRLSKPCEPSRLLAEVARILGEPLTSVA